MDTKNGIIVTTSAVYHTVLQAFILHLLALLEPFYFLSLVNLKNYVHVHSDLRDGSKCQEVYQSPDSSLLVDRYTVISTPLLSCTHVQSHQVLYHFRDLPMPSFWNVLSLNTSLPHSLFLCQFSVSMSFAQRIFLDYFRLFHQSYTSL